MYLIPWRISNFFNVHFHKLYMLAKYGAIDLNTHEYWNNRFQTKDYKESENTANVYTEIIRLITPGSSVLDVGVGTGQLLKQIKATKTNDVFGLDISSVAIEELRKEGINGCCCELPAKPPLNRQFDFVISKSLLEHLKYPRESLRTLAELLHENGTFIISVPNNCLGPEVEPEHLRKYDKVSLHEELSDSFDIKRINIIGKYLLAVCLKRQLVIGI